MNGVRMKREKVQYVFLCKQSCGRSIRGVHVENIMKGFPSVKVCDEDGMRIALIYIKQFSFSPPFRLNAT